VARSSSLHTSDRVVVIVTPGGGRVAQQSVEVAASLIKDIIFFFLDLPIKEGEPGSQPTPRLHLPSPPFNDYAAAANILVLPLWLRYWKITVRLTISSLSKKQY
jgi:hypothetical protein